MEKEMNTRFTLRDKFVFEKQKLVDGLLNVTFRNVLNDVLNKKEFISRSFNKEQYNHINISRLYTESEIYGL